MCKLFVFDIKYSCEQKTLKKEFTKMSYARIINVLFDKQAICKRGAKWKKADLTGMDNIIM